MSDEATKKSTARSAVELVLAGVGGWFCVSSLMSGAGKNPDSSLLTAPVLWLNAWIGTWPSVLLGLGFAAVGAWAFLATRPVEIPRHTLGGTGLALGLSILAGALVSPQGGHLGEVLPSLLGGALGVALGVGMGLLVLLASGWLAWMPKGNGFSMKPSELIPVRAVGDQDEEPTGVSAAEAEALLARPPKAATAATATPGPEDDIRNRGGVPEGAQPLQIDESTRQESPYPPLPVQREADEPAASAGQSAGADLAAAGPQAGSSYGTDGDVFAADDSSLAEPEPRAASSLTSEPAARPLEPSEEVSLRPSWESDDDEAYPEESETPEAVGTEPLPWEGVQDEDPAPEIVPVETMAAEADTATEETGSEPEEVYAEEEGEAEEEEFEDEEEEDPEEVYAEAEEGEAEEEEYEDEESEDPEEVYAEEEEGEAEEEEFEEEESEDPEEVYAEEEGEAEEEEYEDEESEDPEEVYAEEEEGEAEEEEYEEEESEDPEEVYAEEEGEAEEEEYEEEESEDPEEVYAEEEEGEAEEEEFEEEESEDPEEVYAEEEDEAGAEEVAEPAAAGSEAEAEADPEVLVPAAPQGEGAEEAPAIVQSGLFDAEEAGESEVVLTPEAPAAEADAGSDGSAERDLIFEAGCLILEQNRVAVSMLQRRFELDFDQATEVLDQLQSRGLIGPYLGGKTRDILLTREEWTASASGV